MTLPPNTLAGTTIDSPAFFVFASLTNYLLRLVALAANLKNPYSDPWKVRPIAISKSVFHRWQDVKTILGNYISLHITEHFPVIAIVSFDIQPFINPSQ